jgi:hypothetical protein
MRRATRRRPGSPKQDVEGWKANPPLSEKIEVQKMNGNVVSFQSVDECIKTIFEVQ